MRHPSSFPLAAAAPLLAAVPSPFTLLYDTRTPSATPLSGRALSERSGWARIPEDTIAHRFAGDAVLRNDRIAVVLRRTGPGIEIHAIRSRGGPLRAVLAPHPGAEGGAIRLASVKILENDAGAVAVGASFQASSGPPASVRLRLTTGQPFVELAAGDGMRVLRIRDRTRIVVVPDFFGDDMVFAAGAIDARRIGLPAENAMLHLIEGGDAILMCVWASNEQDVDVQFAGRGRERAVEACDIACPGSARLWVACLESPGIWHRRSHAGADRALPWKPPFPARWRADLLGDDGVAASWRFGEEPMPAPPSRGARDIIVYPLDRSRATPLDVYCPIDIGRAALGVGPCQYVLAMEGLDAETQPTPDQVTRWIERQFRRRRERRSSEEIEARLHAMVDHVEGMYARIGAYADLAREVRRLCAEAEGGGKTAEIARDLDRIAAWMEESIAARRDAMKTPREARRLAAAIAALIGTEDPLPACRGLGAEIRSIGTAQDGAMARCRMGVRRLREACRMAAKARPPAPSFVEEIRDRAERMLRRRR